MSSCTENLENLFNDSSEIKLNKTIESSETFVIAFGENFLFQIEFCFSYFEENRCANMHW